jgi:alpha-methylacyl-CoA racemase
MRELQGPFRGLKVIEFAGIGPAPFAGMLLADLGADIVCIDRSEPSPQKPPNVATRGKRLVVRDLKSAAGRADVARLIQLSDVLIEGYRPGVMERLGLGPQDVMEANPGLIYGRMTGWGQSGPLSGAAGHDLNYIALSGALAAIGPHGDRPVPPLNLVGDFGGGSLYLLLGVLAALYERSRSGRGQVIDAAMCDGAASLMTFFYAMLSSGRWRNERGSNLLDGGAHFYRTYRCADNKYVSIACIEADFYKLLLERLPGQEGSLANQLDVSTWDMQGKSMEDIFSRRTRDEWCALLEGTDTCFAPVLDMSEAPLHPHNIARGTFSTIGGVTQPSVAPRLSRTPGKIQGPVVAAASDLAAILREWQQPPATTTPGVH